MTPAVTTNGIHVFYGDNGIEPERWFPTESDKTPFVVVPPDYNKLALYNLTLEVKEKHSLKMAA